VTVQQEEVDVEVVVGELYRGLVRMLRGDILSGGGAADGTVVCC